MARIIARNYDEMDVLRASSDREVIEENELLHLAEVAEESGGEEEEKTPPGLPCRRLQV